MCCCSHAQYHRYWPNFGSLRQYGNLIVEVEEESAEHVYTTRKLVLTDTKVYCSLPKLSSVEHKLMICSCFAPPVSLSLFSQPIFPSSSFLFLHQQDGITHRIQQYQFIGWTNQFFPSIPSFVDFLRDVLKKTKTDHLQRKQRLLVHDM